MSEQFIYLASGSPRRRELLAQLDISFESIVTDIDESLLADEPADAYVRRMARDKARAALQRHPEHRAPVLGAETAVIVERDILGAIQVASDELAWLAHINETRAAADQLARSLR